MAHGLSSVAVARRRPVLLALGCRLSSVLAPWLFRPSSFVSSSARLVIRSLAPSCLSSGGEACVSSSLAARCSACVPWFRLFPAAGRLVPCLSFLLAFPSRLSCGGATVVEDGRLGSGRAACLSRFCLCVMAWVSRACVSLSFDTNIAPSLLSWGRGDISFLVGFPRFSANQRGMQIGRAHV